MNLTDLFLVPYVVSQRLPLLWLESLGVRQGGRRESERMVTEKVEAIGDGLAAAHFEMMQASIDMGMAMMSGRPSMASALRGARRAAEAALAPGQRTLRRNARRLRNS